MQVFQYVAFYNPKTVDGGKCGEKAKIIVEPQTILAKDDKEATLKAARALPEEYVDRLDEVEIAVRPF